MIVIVDYQMGNLRSVQKGFERVGAQAIVSGDADQIRAASKLVLPGVGAFGDAMAELKKRGLVDPIVESIRAGRPFLGICLGLQMLFEAGYEGKRHDGLGILKGDVVRFDLPRRYKVPHMGWNEAILRKDSPVLDGISNGDYFYFVHSFYVVPQDPSCIAIEAEYHHPFCAAVQKDNIFATQFHPEKSQQNGLQILKNFANLS